MAYTPKPITLWTRVTSVPAQSAAAHPENTRSQAASAQKQPQLTYTEKTRFAQGKAGLAAIAWLVELGGSAKRADTEREHE